MLIRQDLSESTFVARRDAYIDSFFKFLGDGENAYVLVENLRPLLEAAQAFCLTIQNKIDEVARGEANFSLVQ